MPESYNVLMPIPEIDQQCPKSNKYRISEIWVYVIKNQSQKFILDFNVSWIYKHKISNSHKLLSHNKLSFLVGKIYPSIFLINRTPTPIPFVKCGRSSYD